MQKSVPEYAIVAEGIRRSFNGTPALRDFSLRVPRGTIYGFLGRNGAGKTTAIKILAGLIKPDGGTVRVLGTDPFNFTNAERERVCYMSEKQILPPQMTTNALIRFSAPLYARWDHELVARLLAHFGINAKKTITSLSQGAQRQVAFILALAPRPELLILDEPAATLDVMARREFLAEILNLVRLDGPTVFLSTHILSDLERVADQIGILVEGTLVVSEPLDLLKDTVKRVRFYDIQRNPAAISLPGLIHSVRAGNEALVTLRFDDEATLAQIANEWMAQYEVQDLNLEEIFVEISRKDGP